MIRNKNFYEQLKAKVFGRLRQNELWRNHERGKHCKLKLSHADAATFSLELFLPTKFSSRHYIWIWGEFLRISERKFTWGWFWIQKSNYEQKEKQYAIKLKNSKWFLKCFTRYLSLAASIFWRLEGSIWFLDSWLKPWNS